MTHFKLTILLSFVSTILMADNSQKINIVSDNDYYRTNPNTGVLKLPPKNHLQQLEDLNLNQSDKGLIIETMPDGSQRVNLQGRFMKHSAVINKNGKIQHICVNHTKDIHSVEPVSERAIK